MKFSHLQIRGMASFALLFALVLTSAPIVLAQYECDITGTPEVRTGALAAGDPTQTGRVFRDGIPSSCTGGVPTAAPVAGSYAYDQYTFTNPTGQNACVTVTLNALGCGVNSTQINAYSTFTPTNVMTGLIGKPGFSTTGTGTLGFPIAAGASFTIVVHDVVNETPTNTYCPNYSFTVSYNTSCRQEGFDLANDGSADPTVWRPATGTWFSALTAGGTNSIQFGLSGDIVTANDFTGNNGTDYGVYRPSNNTFYWGRDQVSPSTNFETSKFGTTGDVPVPADYDADGKTDVAVWRPSNGYWYILRSGTSTLQAQPWGVNGDTPVWGDYDGDLAADLALVRPINGTYRWLILGSNFGYGFVVGCGTVPPTVCPVGVDWGLTSDKLVPGDYDGDARTDIAVWRPSNGTWYHYRSSSATAGNSPGTAATVVSAQWGTNGDIPQPADYDGDRIMDYAVFRPSATPGQTFWYIRNSNGGTLRAVQLGQQGDQPASSPYRIQ